MSLLGYDPTVYYRGRATIEAVSLGIPVDAGEAVFRCNLVTVTEGRMASSNAGHISSHEAAQLIDALNQRFASDRLRFFAGVGYRHILKLGGREESLGANCTPAHDIPGQPVAGYLPQGEGAGYLLELMAAAEEVLADHPVNQARRAAGKMAASGIWLFWGSGQVPVMPPFAEVFGVKAAMTSAVDLLNGLARMAGLTVLQLPGITDGPDNDFAGQAAGALRALESHDLVVIHVEAPDEAGHAGSVAEKTAMIERIDTDIIGPLRRYQAPLRLLIMPDHPTPIALRTHTGEPVPFIVSGDGVAASGGVRLTEPEAAAGGLLVDPGYTIMKRLVTGHGQG
jgi:2,3-bisphosphoglycerate-independent phosphoglycerate mutase